jgi:hypothetical protein
MNIINKILMFMLAGLFFHCALTAIPTQGQSQSFNRPRYLAANDQNLPCETIVLAIRDIMLKPWVYLYQIGADNIDRACTYAACVGSIVFFSAFIHQLYKKKYNNNLNIPILNGLGEFIGEFFDKISGPVAQSSETTPSALMLN